MVASEFPLVQPHLYDAQIPPVVYLSGTLMFIGGLAVVRAHNSWTRDWTLLVTLSGWFFLTLGLFRMFAASHYLRSAATTDATVFMALEGILFVDHLSALKRNMIMRRLAKEQRQLQKKESPWR